MKMTVEVPVEHPLWEVQEGLEKDMIDAGKARFWRKVNEARARGEEASTTHGRHLLKMLLDEVSEAIRGFITEANAVGSGRRHSAVTYVSLLEPDTVAYLALKVVIDSLSKREQLTRTAVRIGTALMDECIMRDFHATDKEKAEQTHRKALEWTHRGQRGKLARLMAARAGVDGVWPESARLHTGMKLIELIKNRTGIVDAVRITDRPKDTNYYLVATERTMEWLGNTTNRMEGLQPAFLPTVVPPRPWTTPWDGGYWTIKGRLTLVKTSKRNYHEELLNLHPTSVYAAVNAVQETPWAINRKVLAVLKEAFDREEAIAKLPAREVPMPPKVPGMDDNPEALKDWKKAASRVYAYNAKVKSKRLQTRMTIDVAERFADYPAIYFPQQLDFRGRMYSVPMFLNPQGADTSKGLLTFAEGKPIGDSETAAGWLAIHGANVFGFDKASLEGRIEWVEQNEARILSVAADPWGPEFQWWTGADKPWQFLAFCFEWAGYKAEGPSFVSCLPVALDGSCNGLQHYSAALRDPVGGKAVNLLPSESPQDIYAEVAEVVKGKLRAFLEPDSPRSGANARYAVLTERGVDLPTLARKWLAFGLDRKITKRAVMTLPYGATQFSCREFIEEALRDKIEDGAHNPFATETRDGLFDASLFLQPMVWEAIGEVVKAAREGMAWLKECAQLAAKEGLPICWTTPDGFLVQQAYHMTTSRRIDTYLDGSVVKLTLAETLPEIDKRLTAQGIAPNWVHSMDATALRQYVNLATVNGIRHFALVHDSYGAVAADVEMMSACLREAFIDLYTEQDPMETFRVHIAELLSEKAIPKLPSVPARGNLDLSEVRAADFFFA